MEMKTRYEIEKEISVEQGSDAAAFRNYVEGDAGRLFKGKWTVTQYLLSHVVVLLALIVTELRLTNQSRANR